MNTHVLISIKSIKALISKKEFQAKNIDDFDVKNEIYSFADGLNKALKMGKQISFDEKEIEEKAEKVAMSSYKLKLHPIKLYREIIHQRLGFKEGYFQALKDLL